MNINSDALNALNKRLQGNSPNGPSAYFVVDITDHNGVSKYHASDAYSNIIGGVVLNVRASFVANTEGAIFVSMNCVRNVDGKKLNNEFSTDAITGIVEAFDEIRLHTQNSVYILRRANG